MDLSLGLPLTPLQSQPIANRVVVPIDPGSKPLEFWNPTGFGFLKPARKGICLMRSHHGPEILGKLIRLVQFFVPSTQRVQLPDLSQFELAGIAHKEPGRLPRCKGCRGGPGVMVLLRLLVRLLPGRLFAHAAEIVPDNRAATLIALPSQFFKEASGVALARLHALLEIGFVGVEFARTQASPRHFWEGRGSEVATNGVPVQSHQGGNRHLAGSLRVQLNHCLIATLASSATSLSLRFRAGERLRLTFPL